jgi:ubiquinone biosynthesis protein COQ9
MSEDPKEKLLDAALNSVPFDGWSTASLAAAARECGLTMQQAQAIFPRGGVGMAVAYHQRGDAAMVARMRAAKLDTMRYRERVVAAVRFRLEAIEDKELVRRAMTLFSLPQHAAEGSRLIWGTADLIWSELGDTSDDINWYSKRAILSGVYASCVLFWLGDTSPDHAASWDFVDRRIANVMQYEKFKSRIRAAPGFDQLMAIPNIFLSRIKPPSRRRDDLPGSWNAPDQSQT